ncbi:MAG TPA: hypothetical protein VK977_06840 [Actinomycetota bacterium]|nr:hypothetical protein [Actinomycetota bacterium]
MPRKTQIPVTREDGARTAPGCPAAGQTIRAYERGVSPARVGAEAVSRSW